MRRSIVLPLVLALAFAGVGQADGAGFDVEGYADLVHRYLKGGFAETVGELSEVSRAEVALANQDYRGGWLDERQMKAAALLHTQVAWATGANESFHLEKAREFLEQIEDESKKARYLGRWYLAVGHSFYWAMRIMDASIAFEKALQWIPDDPELLLAKGSLIQCSAWMLGDDSVLGGAYDSLTRLVDKNSDHDEARLRLAHVSILWERIKRIHGEGSPEKVPKRRWFEKAERELKRVLKTTESSDLMVVAHLLLGDIYRDRAQMDRAIDSYRAAAEIDPSCQPVAVGLSIALRMSGDREGSREAMQRFLKLKSERLEERDLWWRFLRGGSHRWSAIFEELQEEMRR